MKTKMIYNSEALIRDLVEKRIVKGRMGQRDAAEACGVTAPTISRIERGGIPDFATLLRLCEWLGKTPNDYTTFKKVKAA